ncbi:MAG: hypothetical protein AB1760_01345 [Pseudomonadota bacterium]
MEQRVISRDRQELTPTDINNLQKFAQDADDHIVLDGLERGRRFVGFTVTQSTATSVSVAAGRLWFDGKRYFRDEPGGVALDLNGLRPNLQKKIVAIIAWPEEIDTDVQQRMFLTDAETLTYEPQPVAMERRRQARLEAVGGAEAVSPQAPIIDAAGVVIALVEMDPAGISSISRNTAAELRNLGDVADLVEDLSRANAEIEPQVQTIKSDLARLSANLEDGGNKELLLATASDIALIKSQLDIPDSYVGYRGTTFLDAASIDAGFAGHAARVQEGLRFPFAAQAEGALALLNPNAPGVITTAGGMLFPAFTEIERRITKGQNGTLSLAEYSNLENRALSRLTMSRERVRFGADFEVSTGSAFWAGGTYTDRLNGVVRSVFQKNGENFQVYETGRVDAEGHKIVRLSRYWIDSIASPYWSRLPTVENLLGYAHVETFLNPQDAWITALGPHIVGKPALGQLTVGICETERGEPNLDRVLALTTVDAANVPLVGDPGNPPKFAIEPTFLEGGKRYGYFIVTQHAFQIGVADAQNAATQGATGTYYYGLNGGAWFADPSVHLLWRDWRAAFPKARVDVDLQPLQLAGGIQGIDILADGIVPGSTELAWSVQIGGKFLPLSGADPDLLSDLNALLPLRVTFLGTPDVMPAFRLTGSVARVSRMAAAMKAITPSKALTANANTVVQIWRLRGFDPAHHGFTPTVRRADGTIETADTVETVTQPDGVIQKRATFNLAAATNAFRSILDGTTDDPLRTWSVAELVEIAD